MTDNLERTVRHAIDSMLHWGELGHMGQFGPDAGTAQRQRDALLLWSIMYPGEPPQRLLPAAETETIGGGR